MMNMIEIVGEQDTVCVRTNTGDSEEFNTKKEKLEMHIDECSKKLEDPQKVQNLGLVELGRTAVPFCPSRCTKARLLQF